MSEPGYTQGPWGPYGNNPYLTPDELWTPNRGIMEVSPGLTIGSIHHTEPICRVFGYLLPVVANARLIVAAPDLLEVLSIFVDCYPAQIEPLKQRARHLIAKARGE